MVAGITTEERCVNAGENKVFNMHIHFINFKRWRTFIERCTNVL